jgi:hypothetical protein
MRVANKSDSTGSKKVVREWTPVPEQAPTYYVNLVEMRTGLMDMRFRLAEVIDASETETATTLHLKALATLYMSPQHAKSFLALLSRNLKSWEERFGPIQASDEADDSTDSDD